jgi:predicted phage terminase large subunit-like protein
MADIRPQPGPQEDFLTSSSDIVIYGGAAGGGKTYGLLLEGLRHADNAGFRAVIFRRTTPQITNEGGIWDTSLPLYASVGAVPTKLLHTFPSGARLKFSHLEYDKDCEGYQGAQIAFIGFDELTHFTEHQFWYMLSRNRSMCGVRPYIRATTNPDPDSFVARLIDWWINPATGYAIPERSGIVRWFVRENNVITWADAKAELLVGHPERNIEDVKSFTFISSLVSDNKILMEKDPGYLGNLKALSLVDRERLLNGNWKIRACAGTMFRREWFGIVDAMPVARTVVRYWDRAGTEADGTGNPDWTSGTKMSMDRRGIFYIEHVSRFQGSPLTVENSIANTASHDGKRCEIGIEQDPGQAGKAEAEYQVRNLRGYIVHAVPVHRDKVTRAKAYSAQVEAGNVKLLRGEWNEDFLQEHENFPPADGKGKDDQVDSSSGAFMMLASKPRGDAASVWPGSQPAPANDWEG